MVVLSMHCLCIMRFTLPFNGSNNDYRRGTKNKRFLCRRLCVERNVSVFRKRKKKKSV